MSLNSHFVSVEMSVCQYVSDPSITKTDPSITKTERSPIYPHNKDGGKLNKKEGDKLN